MNMTDQIECLIKASHYIDLELQNTIGLRLALFYSLLPESFTTRQALLVGCVLGYSSRMVNKNLHKLCAIRLLEKPSRALYCKPLSIPPPEAK